MARMSQETAALEHAIYNAQAAEDKAADVEGREPRCILTIRDGQLIYNKPLGLPEPMDAYRFMELIQETRTKLERALHEYELTGDHNHGRGPKSPGDSCEGGDCNVTRVRRAILALR